MKSFSGISTLTTIYLFTLVATAGECYLVIIGFDESIIIMLLLLLIATVWKSNECVISQRYYASST